MSSTTMAASSNLPTCCPEIQDMYNVLTTLDNECPQFSDNITTPQFSVIPSEKLKAISYFCSDEKLTSKQSLPVHFQLAGGLPGYKIRTTLRYDDEDEQDRPVKCDKCIHDQRKCSVSHEDTNFCLFSKNNEMSVSYSVDEHGHPFALSTIHTTEEDLSYFVMFNCLNSCESHTKFTKSLRKLKMELLDHDGQVKTEMTWSVRVCKSPKRDHENRLEGPKTRKSVEGSGGLVKKMKTEPKDECSITLHDNDILTFTEDYMEPLLADHKTTKIYDDQEIFNPQSVSTLLNENYNSLEMNQLPVDLQPLTYNIQQQQPQQLNSMVYKMDSVQQQPQLNSMVVKMDSAQQQPNSMVVKMGSEQQQPNSMVVKMGSAQQPAQKPNPMVVNMETKEDKQLVLNIIRRLGGKASEINTTQLL